MALVYRVFDHKEQAWFAAKVLRAEHAENIKQRKRFITEGHTCERLRHRNLVSVHAVIEEDPPYLIMELAPGGSLKDWVDAFGPMPAGRAVDVMIQVCKGISAAHAAGVVHRDIKPHNILLDQKGVAKVTDFGIARLAKNADAPNIDTTNTGDALGTLGYMAPEQRRNGRAADERQDVYGIAATLYYLLTGKVVMDLFIAYTQVQLLDSVPVALRQPILNATTFEPNQRTPTVQALAEALFKAKEKLTPFAGNPPLVSRMMQPMPAPSPTASPAPPRVRRTYQDAITIPPGTLEDLLTPIPVAPATPPPSQRGHFQPVQPAPSSRKLWPMVLAAGFVALVSFTMLSSWNVRRAQSNYIASQVTLFQTIAAEGELIEELAQLGADRSNLDRLFQQFLQSKPESKQTAARAYLDAAQRAASTHHTNNRASVFVGERLSRQAEALAAVDENKKNWERAATNPMGRYSISLGLATAP